MKSLSCVRSLAIILSFASIGFLSGCAGNFSKASLNEPSVPGPLNNGTGDVRGSVYGGRQPILGAHLYLLGASQTAYSVPTSTAETPTPLVGISLLGNTAGYPETCDNSKNLYLDTSGGPLNGHCYYLTGTGTDSTQNNADVGGGFNLSGLYNCGEDGAGHTVANQQVWLYGIGGDPGVASPPYSGSAPNNPAAGLMAALGTCPSAGGNFAGTLSYIYMNEVSTTAFAYAVAGFAADAVHISAPLTNITGLADAFANANQLYDIAGGPDPGNHSGARYKTPNQLGKNPYYLINSVADILANCINSDNVTSTDPDSESTACSVLFYNDTPGASTPPTDTASAAIDIAKDPAVSGSTIFSGTNGLNAYEPWHPNFKDTGSYTGIYNHVVSTDPGIPNELTAAILFSGTGYSAPAGITAGSNGHVYVSMESNDTVADVTPLGALTSSASISTDTPAALTVDENGNLWTIASTKVYEFPGASVSATPTTVSPTLTSEAAPNALLPIAANNGNTPFVFVGDTGNNTLDRIKVSTGAVKKFKDSDLTLSGGGSTTCADGITGVGVDTSDNILVAAGSNVCSLAQSGANGITGTVNYETNIASTLGGLAVDGANNAWVTLPSVNDVGYVTSAGTYSGALNGGGVNKPTLITIDGNGAAWIVNGFSSKYNVSGTPSYPPSISELSSVANGATALSPAGSGTYKGGYQFRQLSYPSGITIDISGDVWVTNASTAAGDPYANSVVEIIGAATPTHAPTLEFPGQPEVKSGDDGPIE